MQRFRRICLRPGAAHGCVVWNAGPQLSGGGEHTDAADTSEWGKHDYTNTNAATRRDSGGQDHLVFSNTSFGLWIDVPRLVATKLDIPQLVVTKLDIPQLVVTKLFILRLIVLWLVVQPLGVQTTSGGSRTQHNTHRGRRRGGSDGSWR